jgi:hypothetical protein
MDPLLKVWMYQSWIEDKKETIDIVKNHAYLLGSFSNPEAVKQIMNEGNKIVSSEEDFEESLSIVKNNSINLPNIIGIEQNKEPIRKRRRRVIEE